MEALENEGFQTGIDSSELPTITVNLDNSENILTDFAMNINKKKIKKIREIIDIEEKKYNVNGDAINPIKSNIQKHNNFEKNISIFKDLSNITSFNGDNNQRNKIDQKIIVNLSETKEESQKKTNESALILIKKYKESSKK